GSCATGTTSSLSSRTPHAVATGNLQFAARGCVHFGANPKGVFAVTPGLRAVAETLTGSHGAKVVPPPDRRASHEIHWREAGSIPRSPATIDQTGSILPGGRPRFHRPSRPAQKRTRAV